MGRSWKDIPSEYKPHWSAWKIEGTPLEDVQKRLQARGLHDPWARNDVWVYSIDSKHYSTLKIVRRGMLPGFVLFLGLLAVKKAFFSEGLLVTKPPHH